VIIRSEPVAITLALLCLTAPSRQLAAQSTESHWKTGAVVGAVAGGVGTFVLLNQGGSTNPCDSDANQDAMGMGACVGIAALGAAGGALIGGLIGSLIRGERRSDLQVEGLRLGVLPPGGGQPLGVSFSFTSPRRR